MKVINGRNLLFLKLTGRFSGAITIKKAALLWSSFFNEYQFLIFFFAGHFFALPFLQAWFGIST
jgi:hypothetical protein